MEANKLKEMFLVTRVYFKEQEVVMFEAFYGFGLKNIDENIAWFEKDEETALLGVYKMMDDKTKKMVYERQFLQVKHKNGLNLFNWDFWWEKIRGF